MTPGRQSCPVDGCHSRVHFQAKNNDARYWGICRYCYELLDTRRRRQYVKNSLTYHVDRTLGLLGLHPPEAEKSFMYYMFYGMFLESEVTWILPIADHHFERFGYWPADNKRGPWGTK